MLARKATPTLHMTRSSETKRRTLKLYNPHPAQLKGHRSTKRFKILIWGRQSGKTTFGLNDTADKSWTGPRDGIAWYILQTYDAAHVAFKRMFKFYRQSPRAFDKKPNESDLACRFKHGPEVQFKSGKNYEDLRIETLTHVVIDEYRQQPSELWPVVIRPMLGARKGTATILSTTNGFDHTKDLWDLAQLNVNEWDCFQAPSTVAPWWTHEEIQSARATMSDDVFAQEIGAEFREIGVGKAYKNHSSVIHGLLENPFSIRGMEWSPFLPIIVGLDFNVGLMCWVLGQKKGMDWYWGDEITIENTDTEECAKVLVQKLQDHQDKLTFPMPPVILVGDASGKARKTSAVGQTDYRIIEKALKDAKIVFENRTPSENPMVKDRVNCVNSLLKSADNSVHMWYHPIRCKYFKRDLERVKWKQGADGAFLDKSDPLATHASDAAGYPIALMSDIFKKEVGRMRVIVR